MARVMYSTGHYRHLSGLGDIPSVTSTITYLGEVGSGSTPNETANILFPWYTGDTTPVPSIDMYPAPKGNNSLQAWLDKLSKTLGVSAPVLGIAGGLLLARLVFGKSR